MIVYSLFLSSLWNSFCNCKFSITYFTHSLAEWPNNWRVATCFSSFLYIYFTLYTELSVSRYGITEQLSTGTGTYYSMYLLFCCKCKWLSGIFGCIQSHKESEFTLHPDMKYFIKNFLCSSKCLCRGIVATCWSNKFTNSVLYSHTGSLNIFPQQIICKVSIVFTEAKYHR